jgi:hypothetical protein
MQCLLAKTHGVRTIHWDSNKTPIGLYSIESEKKRGNFWRYHKFLWMSHLKI